MVAAAAASTGGGGSAQGGGGPPCVLLPAPIKDETASQRACSQGPFTHVPRQPLPLQLLELGKLMQQLTANSGGPAETATVL